MTESTTWYARNRDHTGEVVEVPTGCREEANARQFLAERERSVEKIRAGVLTAAESAITQRLQRPLAEHLDAFDDHLRAKGDSDIYRRYTRRYLDRLSRECEFRTLADLRREALERWLALKAEKGSGAKDRNAPRGALVAFCNWCVVTTRMVSNPFEAVPKANERTDRRRIRRSMTEGELGKLLEVARRRPLEEALMVRKGPRKGERYANVRPDVRERLELLGLERALIYKTSVLTGLRKAELTAVTVGRVVLEDDIPRIELNAAEEKNREGSVIPLRGDLAGDLRMWLADRLRRKRKEAVLRGEVEPETLAVASTLFEVPTGILRILNRDLKAAGINKKDARGRTLDVHAMRTTLGTLLNKAGVAPRLAQKGMRHSDLKLTMNVYTDPALLDSAAALEALPALPLKAERAAAIHPDRDSAGLKAGNGCTLRCTPRVQLETIEGKNCHLAGESGTGESGGVVNVSACPVNRKGSLTTSGSEPYESGRQDLNLRPHGPEPCALPS